MEVSPDSFRVLIGFHYIDDTIREELRRQKQLEDALRDAELQNEIISVISAIYHSIFRIDLTTDTVYFISGSDALRREITPGGVPYARLTDSLDRVTAPEFAERAKKFRDLSTLPERLAQTDSVAFEYRTKGGDWHICRFFVKKRDENGRVTHVLYANRLTSDFILRERNWYVIAEEANRASAAKTDFLSRMAHDIRTPLNALLGFAEIAEQNVNDPERLRDALGKLNSPVASSSSSSATFSMSPSWNPARCGSRQRTSTSSSCSAAPSSRSARTPSARGRPSFRSAARFPSRPCTATRPVCSRSA